MKKAKWRTRHHVRSARRVDWENKGRSGSSVAAEDRNYRFPNRIKWNHFCYIINYQFIRPNNCLGLWSLGGSRKEPRRIPGSWSVHHPTFIVKPIPSMDVVPSVYPCVVESNTWRDFKSFTNPNLSIFRWKHRCFILCPIGNFPFFLCFFYWKFNLRKKVVCFNFLQFFLFSYYFCCFI